MEIAVEYVRWLWEEITKINRAHLDQITFYENGRKLDIDPKIIKEFVFTGLSNKDFILTDFYKDEGQEEKEDAPR